LSIEYLADIPSVELRQPDYFPLASAAMKPPIHTVQNVRDVQIDEPKGSRQLSMNSTIMELNYSQRAIHR
jgi:hypothetical protein